MKNREEECLTEFCKICIVRFRDRKRAMPVPEGGKVYGNEYGRYCYDVDCAFG
jgi:hypothetical protein